MLDPAINGPEGSEEATVGVMTALEDLLAVPVGVLAELLAQGGDG